jgi:two-component system, LytTR family, response regulator
MTMETVRALIVDDEEPARTRIRDFLEETPGIETIGECPDGVTAIRAIRDESPDLVLLDIQMSGIGGFEVIEEVGTRAVPAYIFTTAYDQFAVRAFEVNAVDYLLKPFSRERFQRALNRATAQVHYARQLRTGHVLPKPVYPPEERRNYLSRIEVKLKGRTFLLPVEEIDWIGGAGNYAEIHAGKKSYLIREKLSSLSGKLDPTKFVRIHRSTIANINCVAKMAHLFNGDYALFLRDGTRLVLSRTNHDKFFFILRKCHTIGN